LGVFSFIIIFLISAFLPKIIFAAAIGLSVVSLIALLIIIVLRKRNITQRYKLPFILSLIGISISVLLFISSFVLDSIWKKHDIYIRMKENVDTEKIIYWKIDDKEKCFYYNDRTYKLIDINDNIYFEVDEEIANITYKENSSSVMTIYTIKNCTDLSLLSTSNDPNKSDYLYCDVDLIEEKKVYYENKNNYNYFISKTERFRYIESNVIVSRSLSRNDFDILEKIKYDYNDSYIEIPGKEYESINIYGISLDGAGQRIFNNFLIDDNKIYYAIRYSIATYPYFVVELSNEEKALILSLLEGE